MWDSFLSGDLLMFLMHCIKLWSVITLSWEFSCQLMMIRSRKHIEDLLWNGIQVKD